MVRELSPLKLRLPASQRKTPQGTLEVDDFHFGRERVKSTPGERERQTERERERERERAHL